MVDSTVNGTDCVEGGVAFVQNAFFVLNNSVVENANASDTGGAFKVYASGEQSTPHAGLKVDRSWFAKCNALVDGGAIQVINAGLHVTESLFDGCSAADRGTAISIETDEGQSSELRAVPYKIDLSHFDNNVCGGGEGMPDGEDLDDYACAAVSVHTSCSAEYQTTSVPVTIEVSGSAFTGNVGGYGVGGLMVAQNGSAACAANDVVVHSSNFTENQGAILAAHANLDVSDSNFIKNVQVG